MDRADWIGLAAIALVALLALRFIAFTHDYDGTCMAFTQPSMLVGAAPSPMTLLSCVESY